LSCAHGGIGVDCRRIGEGVQEHSRFRDVRRAAAVPPVLSGESKTCLLVSPGRGIAICQLEARPEMQDVKHRLEFGELC
jgi:hypothetical protein